MDGKGISVHVTEAHLCAIPDPSPDVLAMLRDAHNRGWLNGMVWTLLHVGKVTTVGEALQYLHDLSSGELYRLRLAMTDFSGSSRPYMVRTFTRLLVDEAPEVRHAPHMRHGQLGHTLANLLFTGDVRFTTEERLHGAQLHLFGDDTTIPIQHHVERIPLDEFHMLLYRLRRNAMSIVRGADGGEWKGWQHKSRAYQALCRDLMRLAPDLVGQLWGENEVMGVAELVPMTLVSWAWIAAARRHLRTDRVLFTEVPVFHARHQVSGGRIDALEVRRINGRPPDRRAHEMLRHLATTRFNKNGTAQSVGDLLSRLVHVFGDNLDVVVYDWKFLVGDVWRYWGDRRLPTLDNPLPKHLDQMRRYLTFIPLDYALGRRRDAEWHTLQHIRLTGELWYFQPQRPVLVHTVSMTSDERIAYLEHVAAGFSDAERVAEQRRRHNFTLRHLVHLLGQPIEDREKGTGAKKTAGLRLVRSAVQLTLHAAEGGGSAREVLRANGIALASRDEEPPF